MVVSKGGKEFFMQEYTFLIFMAIGAYLIIGEAIFRVRRNTKRGKRAEEVIGVKGTRIMNLVLGALVIAAGFFFHFFR